MKAVLLALLALLLAALGTVAAQQYENPPKSCSTQVDVRCELIGFIGDDMESALMVEKMTISEPSVGSLFLSDFFVQNLLGELSGDGSFYGFIEVTPQYKFEKSSALTEARYRVYEGKTDSFRANSDVVAVFLKSDAGNYVVMAVNVSNRDIEQYIETLIDGEDFTKEPNGFTYFPQ